MRKLVIALVALMAVVTLLALGLTLNQANSMPALFAAMHAKV